METPSIESIKWHIVKDLDHLPEVPEEGCKGDLYIVDPRPLGCEIGAYVYNDERLVWECVIKYIWDPETNEISELNGMTMVKEENG